MENFSDSFGRSFKYLRLSVTDRCNFRCVYCLPNGYQAAQAPREPELSVEEIRRLCAGFGQLGFSKIRLTGGEPTIRRDLVSIVEAAASVPGIRTVALTTNGHRLERLAGPLKDAGLRAVNVSLDSLDPSRFQAITGNKCFSSVLRGIDQALAVGIETVKINAVLLKDITDAELGAFLDWVRERPVVVRFIELMKTRNNQDLFKERHLSAGTLQLFLLENGWQPEARKSDAGPAFEFSHLEYQGRIGLIAPYAREFCANCNRLRVSSRGQLRLCLFGEEDFNLRPYLRGSEYARDVASQVARVIFRKPESHFLREGKYGNTWNLASIGG